MALIAKLVRDSRGAERETLDVAGTLRHVRNGPIDVVVEDLSVTGFRVRTEVGLDLHEKVTVGIPGIGQRTAYIVRQTGDGFGCEFLKPIDPQLVSAPANARSVVEVDFGGQLDQAMVREWSRQTPPEVERVSRGQRLLVVGGLGVAGWLTVIGIIALL
ncbi:PilZ domain-containing protein [Sphingomonas glacialis]|uniref:PilZ domain-containing protein n=1 Tax=Sphingomonas glacialis TaxID=658225 RepID=A0A502G0T3_9SPHN|nr:PilZ domain-containing protein [Sphingomonas glacialis]TPG54743.1 hypothetical protein EAH76_08955 [Sphingomonas glacialis]